MNLFGTASIFFGANVINAVIPFLMLPVLTRFLSPADYGAVGMFLITINIFNAFTGLNVHGAVGIRFFQLPESDLADYTSSCVGVLLVSSFLCLTFVLLLSGSIVVITGLEIKFIILAVLASGIQFLIQIRLAIWQANGGVWKYAALQVLRSLIDSSLSLFLVLYIKMGKSGRIYGYSLSICLISLISVIWLTKDKLLKRPSNWRGYAKDAIFFGLPLIPHTVGGLLMGYADRFNINRFIGTDAVGVYMVAVQVANAITLVTESFNKSYGPWLFKKLKQNIESEKIKIVKMSYAYIIFFLILSITYGLLVPKLIPYLVGKQFIASTEVVFYVSIGFGFGGCYYVVSNYLFYANKTKSLAVASLLTGFASFPITYILIKCMQLRGAAVASMVSNIILFIWTWVLASKAHKMPWTLRLKQNPIK
jgi:O-antigen/teichoic acid export membrane protein